MTFMKNAMKIEDSFYRLVAVGLGVMYIFQVFLTVGGGIKFIPLTGVTLPLISYGGSSVLMTLVMFSIVEGLYIIREDEEALEKQKKKARLRNKKKAAKAQLLRERIEQYEEDGDTGEYDSEYGEY